MEEKETRIDEKEIKPAKGKLDRGEPGMIEREETTIERKTTNDDLTNVGAVQRDQYRETSEEDVFIDDTEDATIISTGRDAKRELAEENLADDDEDVIIEE